MTFATSKTAVVAFAFSIALWTLSKLFIALRRRARTTSLSGPPRSSLLFGVSRSLNESADQSAIYDEWAKQYGPVYKIPTTLGNERIVISDPKAISHFYARDSWVYMHSPMTKIFIENMFGRGLLWAEGESHKRQRKALSPAFSNVSIKNIVPVFCDCAHKAEAAWDAILESSPSGDAIIDVQEWMNRISLDVIGIAGFSHDFRALDGITSPVAAVFEAFGAREKPSAFAMFIFLLGFALPIFAKLPTTSRILARKFRNNVKEISEELLSRARDGKADGDKSIVGLLIRAENADSELRMSSEQIQAQIALLILAGYETTSVSLTWALIELSKKPEIQAKLREELASLGGADPTWEQLTNGLPYLDAVAHEALRLHPSVGETTRVSAQEDVLPLSEPLHTPSGKVVDRIAVAKGTSVSVSIAYIGRSTEMWGPSAKEFIPERWLRAEGSEPGRAQELQGHRHLLNFSDGARICLGRGFAVAEFKTALSLLVRNYSFELPGGPDTVIEIHRGVLPRPKVAGEKGSRVPLRVRRLN